jgi:hypothetical protein
MVVCPYAQAGGASQESVPSPHYVGKILTLKKEVNVVNINTNFNIILKTSPFLLSTRGRSAKIL